jgi:hypothetical protein
MSSVPSPPEPESDPKADSEADRLRLEEEGFEALQRLYAESLSDTTEGAVCARLLLGLYNGQRFPFDLTDLRVLPAAEFADAMRVIAMDARLTRQEVHEYFQAGSRKFEDLVRQHDVTDIVRLREHGDGTPTPPPQRGTLRHGDYVSAKLVGYGNAPGYRDVTLTFDCEVVGEEGRAVGPVRLQLNLNPTDGVDVMQHVQHVHAFAWRNLERGPLDRRAGEHPPRWVDHVPDID